MLVDRQPKSGLVFASASDPLSGKVQIIEIELKRRREGGGYCLLPIFFYVDSLFFRSFLFFLKNLNLVGLLVQSVLETVELCGKKRVVRRFGASI